MGVSLKPSTFHRAQTRHQDHVSMNEGKVIAPANAMRLPFYAGRMSVAGPYPLNWGSPISKVCYLLFVDGITVGSLCRTSEEATGARAYWSVDVGGEIEPVIESREDALDWAAEMAIEMWPEAPPVMGADEPPRDIREAVSAVLDGLPVNFAARKYRKRPFALEMHCQHRRKLPEWLAASGGFVEQYDGNVWRSPWVPKSNGRRLKAIQPPGLMWKAAA